MTKIIKTIHFLKSNLSGNIGFFSGSFNPPHYGHLKLAEESLKTCVDYIVFCIHSFNKEKENTLVSTNHRMKMVNILIGKSSMNDKLFIADNSLINGLYNDKFIKIANDIISRGNKVHIIIGSDCFSKDYYMPLLNYTHIIGLRNEKIDFKVLFSKNDFSFYFLKCDVQDSSSRLRKLIAAGGCHTDSELDIYIRKYKLYQ